MEKNNQRSKMVLVEPSRREETQMLDKVAVSLEMPDAEGSQQKMDHANARLLEGFACNDLRPPTLYNCKTTEHQRERPSVNSTPDGAETSRRPLPQVFPLLFIRVVKSHSCKKISRSQGTQRPDRRPDEKTPRRPSGASPVCNGRGGCKRVHQPAGARFFMNDAGFTRRERRWHRHQRRGRRPGRWRQHQCRECRWAC